MLKQDLVGYRINQTIFCDLCGMRRDKGGWILRSPIVGKFCSAEHARVAVERKLEKTNYGGNY
jgi:hypothetical protein